MRKTRSEPRLASKAQSPPQRYGGRREAERRVAQLGFKSLDAYFLARGACVFVRVAEELRVSTSTVQRWYDDYLRRYAGYKGPQREAKQEAERIHRERRIQGQIR